MKKTIFILISTLIIFSCKKEEIDPFAVDQRGSFIDSRDQEQYNWVKIGSQIWMAENLRATKYCNGEEIATSNPLALDITTAETPEYQWAFNGDETSVKSAGRLYTWYSASDSRNICPAGWHLPSNDEWNEMQNYLIQNGFNYNGSTTENKISKALSATTKWSKSNVIGAPGNSDFPEYADKSGFSAIPNGYRALNGVFIGVSEFAYWWGSTEISESKACARGIHSYTDTVRADYFSKKYAFSVRCVKD